MDNGLLIVKACFKTGSNDRAVMHDNICKQLEKGNVVVLPLGWIVEYYPLGTEVVVDTNEGQTPLSTTKKECEKRDKSCNTCKNNDDEFSGECYECLKGIFDHYEPEEV